jgi:hypothetical protein
VTIKGTARNQKLVLESPVNIVSLENLAEEDPRSPNSFHKSKNSLVGRYTNAQPFHKKASTMNTAKKRKLADFANADISGVNGAEDGGKNEAKAMSAVSAFRARQAAAAAAVANDEVGNETLGSLSMDGELEGEAEAPLGRSMRRGNIEVGRFDVLAGGDGEGDLVVRLAKDQVCFLFFALMGRSFAFTICGGLGVHALGLLVLNLVSDM